MKCVCFNTNEGIPLLANRANIPLNVKGNEDLLQLCDFKDALIRLHHILSQKGRGISKFAYSLILQYNFIKRVKHLLKGPKN